MLEAARERKADGVDVVVGFVETHGRAETEALLEGLEVLPPRLVRLPRHHARGVRPRRGAGAQARPSSWSTSSRTRNAPGSRHAKRWQDVEELLDAGIDVYTTLNVQHLESLNDVVAQITGVVVRETVPDSVLERADEIELVDLPPDELLERLQEGKVYVPEQAQAPCRTSSARATSSRCASWRSGARPSASTRRCRRTCATTPSPRPGPWPSGSWSASARARSRAARARGRRLATHLGAEWIVAYVETPAAAAKLSQADRDRVVQTLRLAEQLGAETVTLTGPTMSEELLAYARARNVSKIVVGKPARTLWKRILMGSIVDALVRGSGEIDIYVVSAEKDAPGRRP